jgi:hypothetical protein
VGKLKENDAKTLHSEITYSEPLLVPCRASALCLVIIVCKGNNGSRSRSMLFVAVGDDDDRDRVAKSREVRCRRLWRPSFFLTSKIIAPLSRLHAVEAGARCQCA